jgi:hypothetical protein
MKKSKAIVFPDNPAFPIMAIDYANGKSEVTT